MLDANGGYGSAVMVRVRCMWNGKGTKDFLERSCLIHEMWLMKVEHEVKLGRTEMSMIRWMDMWIYFKR